MTITPSREDFKQLARQGNLISVYRSVLADRETPVSVFERLAHEPNAFLLESVTGGEQLARYSFLGANPRTVLRSRGKNITIITKNNTQERTLSADQDPVHILQELLSGIQYVEIPGLPRFVGGAVGYIGYDWVRFLEPIPTQTTDDLNVDDMHLMLTDTLCIFDHVKHRMLVLANAEIGPHTDLDIAYDEAVTKVNALVTQLTTPLTNTSSLSATLTTGTGEFTSNLTREQYNAMVLKGKEYIEAGDIIQVVLAQRFSKNITAPPFDVYRALRSINPSPYMFYLKFDTGTILVGASPEILVTEERGNVRIRPIAGTRKRGETPEEDARLSAELLADEKERAEHIMLVDLARNDIGRVCEYGSVKVDELMVIEKYSHVLHIVSNISGRLAEGKNAYDLLRATFPAGTLSGAPKVRAMQIIEELEPTKRGPYGGAIGYFSYNGNFDACITLRTALIKDGKVYVQAGGGIVADSNPDDEFLETWSKSAAVRKSVEMAEMGLEEAVSAQPLTASRWTSIEVTEPVNLGVKQ
jgi:anthranilate synthase component I